MKRALEPQNPKYPHAKCHLNVSLSAAMVCSIELLQEAKSVLIMVGSPRNLERLDSGFSGTSVECYAVDAHSKPRGSRGREWSEQRNSSNRLLPERRWDRSSRQVFRRYGV